MFIALLDESLDEGMVRAIFSGEAVIDPSTAFIVTEGKLDVGHEDIDPRNPHVIANLRATAAMINRLCKVLEEKRTIALRREEK